MKILESTGFVGVEKSLKALTQEEGILFTRF